MDDEQPPTGRNSDKFMLRLPDGVREQVATEARKNNRSMNAEIISRLQATFDSDKYQVGLATAMASPEARRKAVDTLVDHLIAAVKERYPDAPVKTEEADRSASRTASKKSG